MTNVEIADKANKIRKQLSEAAVELRNFYAELDGEEIPTASKQMVGRAYEIIMTGGFIVSDFEVEMRASEA